MESVPVRIRAGEIELAADVAIPINGRGLVLFAHGSGSSRLSPRNRQVARFLNRGGLATLLADLLTKDEEKQDLQRAELRFDIPLLGVRVTAITDWIGAQATLRDLPLGYFGASTGAAAALVAAAERPDVVRAVVSRGGRPDLAGSSLKRVHAPTLFIVGSNDKVVLDLNRAAAAQMPRAAETKLEVIAGASHLFEEPGALDQVFALARDWFTSHFGGASNLSSRR